MKTINGKEYLSTLEVAKEYPVCNATIRLWVAQGKLTPDYRILKRVYFLRSTLDQFFKQ